MTVLYEYRARSSTAGYFFDNSSTMWSLGNPLAQGQKGNSSAVALNFSLDAHLPIGMRRAAGSFLCLSPNMTKARIGCDKETSFLVHLASLRPPDG